MKPWRLVCLCAALALGIARPAIAGDVIGRVTITSRVPRPIHGPRPTKVFAEAPPPEPQKDEVLNVVVYIDKIDGYKIPESTPPAVMVQENKEFKPAVLPVLVGQRVDFPNKDKIYHHVYSESLGHRFDFSEYQGGESRSYTFSTPGVAELFCNIHARMNATILVLQNPFFALANDKHVYIIKNVPPGKYKLTAWHPRIKGTVSKEVDVPKTGPVTVDFEL